jgi:hypothetical protein
LIKALSDHAEPVVFPPITVQPENMVSNEILPAIRSCDSLAFIAGGKSEESYWVALERDYARRAGLKVYAYDPILSRITRDNSQPLKLPVFASYSRGDGETVSEIVDFMKRERYFNLVEDVENPPDLRDQLRGAIHGRLALGGYMTLFWSRKASESRWVEHELSEVLKTYADRIMLALLDETPLPVALTEGHNASYTDERMERALVPVHLYQDDGRGLNWQRVDDLIVRLYWLILRHRNRGQGGHNRIDP